MLSSPFSECVGAHACVAAVPARGALPVLSLGRVAVVRRHGAAGMGALAVVGCGVRGRNSCHWWCLGIIVFVLCVRAGTGSAASGRSSSKAGSRLPIGVGTSLGASSLVLFAVSCFLWRRKRRHSGGPSSVLGILGNVPITHQRS